MRRPHMQNDDWFNLGKLLALNWNKNYEDRGRNKGLNLVDDMYNSPAPTDEEMVEAKGEMRNKLMENPATLTGMIPGKYRINPGGNDSGGLTEIIPQEYGINPGTVTPDTNSGGLLSKMFPKPAENQSQGLFAQFEKFDPERANAIRVATTPDEGGVLERARQMSKNRQAADFNAADFVANVDRGIANMKLSPEARQAVLEYASTKGQTGQRQAYEKKSDELLTEYNSLMKNGNYPEAFALLPQIAKYNQPAAQMLYGGGVSLKDVYTTNKREELSDKEFKQQLIKGDINFDHQVNLAQFNRVLANASYEDRIKIQQKYGLNIGGKGNQNYGGYSKAQIDMANKMFTDAAKYAQDNYGDMSKYPYKEQLKIAEQIRDDILSGGQQRQKSSTIPNIPKELQGFISKLTPNSTSKDILAEYLKDEQIQDFLASNPQYVEWFENQTGLMFPKKNAPKTNNSNNNFVAQSNNLQNIQKHWSD